MLASVLLHDHLDGGVRPQTVLELATAGRYGALPAEDPTRLAAWFDQSRSGSLERYLTAFVHTIRVMQTGEALTRVAYEAAQDLAAQGVVYAELRFAPSMHTAKGLTSREVVSAVLDGLRQGAREPGLAFALIIVAMRQESDSEAVARLAVELRGEGVVGFDLAGPEAGYPPDHHLAACRAASESGLGLTLHAGEGAGLHSIGSALLRCSAHRIGHGLAIIDDCRIENGEIAEVGRLAGLVRDRQVPLEVCPSSNLHTKGWRPEQHPVGMLHRAGFNVTISTDNRLMSNTTIDAEFELLRRYHGFTIGDFGLVTRRALRAAFAPWPLKRRLWEQRIRPSYAQAGEPLGPWE